MTREFIEVERYDSQIVLGITIIVLAILFMVGFSKSILELKYISFGAIIGIVCWYFFMKLNVKVIPE